MNQNQLELPQVSLARYVDLLKRRRWQVIPVSLLGLLIGGIVAFFIPRYFVVDSMVEYHKPPDLLGGGDKRADDPFGMIVGNARYTLPRTAGATMKLLGWSEANEPDEFERRQNEREVELRVNVVDVTQSKKDQDYAQLMVSYRDRDGRRAADFMNNLLEGWRKSNLDALQARAQAMKQAASSKVADANATYDEINKNLEDLSSRYGFQRTLVPEVQREQLRDARQEEKEQLKLRDDLQGSLAGLEKELEALQARLTRMPRTVDLGKIELTDRFDKNSAKLKDFLLLQSRQKSLEEAVGPAHPLRRLYELDVQRLQKKLGDTNVDADDLKNPELAKLQEQIEQHEKDIAEKKARLTVLTKRMADDETRRHDRVQAESQWSERMRQLELAKSAQEQAQGALAAANAALEQLSLDPPITFNKVGVPPRPTDPNPLLVAAVGCIVGLGLAIGLILLLDVLQGTFKTVDDVERALPVPVLGGMSHFETDDQRRRLRAGRRRASLVAAGFLGSAVIVVTVYYVAPERLPSFALGLLSLVLGK